MRWKSRWDFPFFGLTLATKEDLFLKEVESICYAYSGMSYWDAYGLPVPVRKWLIKTWNKRQEEIEKQRQGTPSSDKPLSDAERQRFIKKAQQLHADPSHASSKFMHPVRNKK